jgi:hypothetical protein
MADHTPLSSADPYTSGQPDTQALPMNRTRSREMIDDVHHPHIVDEDPLLISQTLTYVTDDGSVVHSFHSAPLKFGTWSGAITFHISVLSFKFAHAFALSSRRLQGPVRFA